ncbi:hypothetical protein ACIGO9_31285 [Nocardia asteroides]|uniref:hypothetical protein n=1 Tax=Nocardia asteroides TaxID=1824 RepID=UPI0037CBFB04
MGSKSFARAVIASGALLGAILFPTAAATADPVPVSPFTEIDEPIEDDDAEAAPVESGSSFSGPGFSGSSTTGSSGTFNSGSSGDSEESGSAEDAAVGFLGRLLRGAVTGS